jgi:D-sedoheptulose 7-phosphate isomerase
MKDLIKSHIQASISTKQAILADQKFQETLLSVGNKLRASVAAGGTIFVCGNGGSTCDAMHFTEELVARYKAERPGVKAMHFGDSSTITCWANDYDFESAFERQAETFCGPNDVIFGITTSGNSKNVLRAVRKAREKGAYTVGFTGKDGGQLKNEVDQVFIVPSNKTEIIQESHIMCIHILCEFFEPINNEKN